MESNTYGKKLYDKVYFIQMVLLSLVDQMTFCIQFNATVVGYVSNLKRIRLQKFRLRIDTKIII